MSHMTHASFNRSGIVDLSTLAPKAAPPAGTSYVVDVDEGNFESVMRKSVQHPIVVELYSPRAQGADQLSADLIELANAAGGAYLLARVNVDVAQQIPQVFGIQAVPTVVGVLAGQLAPLFQGTKPKQEVATLISQLIQAAAANGVTGRAEPVAKQAGAEGTDEVAPDPRYAAADDALQAGDYALAVAEFDKILAQTPGDAEAKLGRAQASLLDRLGDVDPKAALEYATDHPDDIDAQLTAADLELVANLLPQAFGRLIRVVRETAGAERDRVRLRLLELFELIGNADPDVLKARRELMSALF